MAGDSVQIINPPSWPVPVTIVGGSVGSSGGLTDAELRATPVSITGTLTDAQLRATALTVTGPLTDTQLRAAALAVTGPVTDAQLRATALPVSLAALPALSAGANVIGAVTQSGAWVVSITGSVAVTGPLTDAQLRATAVSVTGPLTDAQLRATAVSVTGPLTDTQLRASAVTVSGPLTDTQLRASSVPVTATGPTLTKGTQAATGYSVQALKDAGRTTIALTAEFTFAQVAETLLSMTLSSNGAATSTFTSRVLPNSKKFRIQSAILQIEALGSGTAPQRAYLRMRVNAAGAVTVANGQQQWILPVGVSAAVVKASNWSSLEVPDGFELTGDGTLQYAFTLETPDWVVTTATGRAKITIFGFEF